MLHTRSGPGYWLVVGGLIIALFFVFVNKAARADGYHRYPIYAPSECAELAQREGVPMVIQTVLQEAKARAKMAMQNRRDPIVRQCRAAIQRLKEMRQ